MAKETTDRAVRTLTEDGGFRVITAVTTQTVREALKRQEASGHAVGLLGGLITGAVLIREAMTPEQRVQILIKSRAGRHLAVADAHPDGRNRGLLRAGADDELSATAGPAGDSNGDSDNGAAHGALLEVIYTLPNGIIHQSRSALPADGDLSAGLMTYLQESVQVVSIIAVATVLDGRADGDPAAIRAGGYLIQLMPDAEHDALARMTAQLEGVSELSELLAAPDLSPDTLRDAVIGDLSVERMIETPLYFGCSCNRGRILTGLASLGAVELDEMIAEGQPLDIRCDACRQPYTVSVADLRALRARLDGANSGPAQAN